MDRNLLPSIAAFVEVARQGSFRRAAARLNISPSALSQAVRLLEERLAVRLLHRTTRSLSLTEEGRALMAQAERGLDIVAEAIGALDEGRHEATGEIRINLSRSAAHLLVEPHIGEFAQRYPSVRVELLIDDGLGDIVRDGCDAGIRLRESLVDSMISVPLTPPFSMAVVGAPSYFAFNPAPDSPADLDLHNCVGFRQADSGAVYGWEFTDPRSGEDLTIDPRGNFVTNSDDVMLAAALAGVGLVMHFDAAVREHVRAGALIRVLKPWCRPFDGFNLYMLSREQIPLKLRVFVDFLVEKRQGLMAKQDI